MQRAKAMMMMMLVLLLGTGASRADKAGEVRTRAFQLLNEGVSAYNRGLYAEAVDKLEASAALALNSFRANFYLGLALYGARRHQEAVDALTVALDLDPNHLPALVALGDGRLALGDADEARAAYARALKLRPGHAPALDGLARTYESQADDERAIDHFRQAVASDKGFAAAYTHLGDLYLRQDRLEEAVALLEEAIAIRPDYAMGLNRLALAYGRLGLDNEAVATVQRAIELEPENPEHWASLGRLQLARGALAAAEASLRRALALDGSLADTRGALAELMRRRGDYAAALAELDAVLALPDLGEKREARLRANRVSTEQELASATALEAKLAAGSAEPADLELLAALYARRAAWDRAVTVAARAIEEDPAGPRADTQERLAYLLARAGQLRQAQELYAELVRRGGSAAIDVNEGVTLALLGDDAAAIEAYRRALAREPAERRARLYLANALLRLGRTREAAEAYTTYLTLVTGGETAERVRRILKQIAPDLLPPPAPSDLTTPPPQHGGST